MTYKNPPTAARVTMSPTNRPIRELPKIVPLEIFDIRMETRISTMYVRRFREAIYKPSRARPEK